MEPKYLPCKSALSKSALPGLVYTFNSYVGCTHGCLYCYVPDVMRRAVPGQDWGKYVFVKEGIIEKLRADLRHHPQGMVGVSTVTDPYQPIEEKLGLIRKALIAIGSAGFTASIQTKSPLVSRDLDLIRTFRFELGMTITSVDDRFQRLFEPGAPPPKTRIRTLEEASALGIKTWIFYGPIIPGYNDSEGEMATIVDLARRTGSHILYDKINLKPLAKMRLRSALTPEAIQVLHGYDFKGVYLRLEKISRAYGVLAKSAFP